MNKNTISKSLSILNPLSSSFQMESRYYLINGVRNFKEFKSIIEVFVKEKDKTETIMHLSCDEFNKMIPLFEEYSKHFSHGPKIMDDIEITDFNEFALECRAGNNSQPVFILIDATEVINSIESIGEAYIKLQSIKSIVEEDQSNFNSIGIIGDFSLIDIENYVKGGGHSTPFVRGTSLFYLNDFNFTSDDIASYLKDNRKFHDKEKCNRIFDSTSGKVMPTYYCCNNLEENVKDYDDTNNFNNFYIRYYNRTKYPEYYEKLLKIIGSRIHVDSITSTDEETIDIIERSNLFDEIDTGQNMYKKVMHCTNSYSRYVTRQFTTNNETKLSSYIPFKMGSITNSVVLKELLNIENLIKHLLIQSVECLGNYRFMDIIEDNSPNLNTVIEDIDSLNLKIYDDELNEVSKDYRDITPDDKPPKHFIDTLMLGQVEKFMRYLIKNVYYCSNNITLPYSEKKQPSPPKGIQRNDQVFSCSDSKNTIELNEGDIIAFSKNSKIRTVSIISNNIESRYYVVCGNSREIKDHPQIELVFEGQESKNQQLQIIKHSLNNIGFLNKYKELTNDEPTILKKFAFYRNALAHNTPLSSKSEREFYDLKYKFFEIIGLSDA